MGTISRMLFAGAAALALAGCTISPPTTDYRIPVYGNPVNPTPVANYRVECETVPNFTHALFLDYATGCRQTLAPPAVRRGVVVRAKG